MPRFERTFLYVAVLALAIAVGFLAHKVQGRSQGGCPPQSEDVWAQLAEQVNSLASGLGELKAAVLGMEQSQATLIRSELERLASQIADSVYAKLRKDGACLSSVGSCPEPKPASVVNDFTFLYENARLNDAGEVKADNVGVKLATRHERRLEMLERAFRPCQQEGGPKVSFKVTGYSSTAEFQEESPSGGRRRMAKSNEMNRATANLRAEVVATRLRRAGFDVTHTDWKFFEDLQRRYLDDSVPGVDQQALNRSVFIQVGHAGACHIERLTPPAQP